MAKTYQPSQQQQRSQVYTRTRLLNQLGYFKPNKATTYTKIASGEVVKTTPKHHNLTIEVLGGVSQNSQNNRSNERGRSSVLGSVVPFETKLNDLPTVGESIINKASMSSFASWIVPQPSTSPPLSTTSSSNSLPTSNTAGRQLQFHETVQVIPIPSRYQYSDRIKQCIWSSRYELQEMAERNVQEFESEGYDWRNVILEDEMYMDRVNGNLIHPCHVDEHYQQRGRGKVPSDEENNVGQRTKKEGETLSDDDNDDDDDNDGFVPLQRHEAMVQ